MRKKLLMAFAIVGCAVLLVAGSVAGTVAYLTSKAEVKNTFTVGNVAITLTETKVDVYGVALTGEEAGRRNENDYKLIPGRKYLKDPIIHVDDDSESCWLFVQVTNGIAEIEDKTLDDAFQTIAEQMEDEDNWTCIDTTNNVYAYKAVVAAGADITVFDYFKLAGSANVANYASATIDITAYAVQADGFTTPEAAWEAAKDAFATNP